MSRQVMHYHFDGKYDLISSFLEYIIDQYEGSVEVDDETDPRTELDDGIDRCLFDPEFDDFSHWDRMTGTTSCTPTRKTTTSTGRCSTSRTTA